jgi:hypothetical protein
MSGDASPAGTTRRATRIAHSVCRRITGRTHATLERAISSPAAIDLPRSVSTDLPSVGKSAAVNPSGSGRGAIGPRE